MQLLKSKYQESIDNIDEMASLQLLQLIKDSYGKGCNFAVGDHEKELAIRSVQLAKKEGISYKEFFQLHFEYLTTQLLWLEDKCEQMSKIKKYKKYFR